MFSETSDVTKTTASTVNLKNVIDDTTVFPVHSCMYSYI